MKTIKKIDDRTVEIDGKKYALVEEPKKKLWEPRGGEWFLAANGSADSYPSDEKSRLFGSEFRTKEEAECTSKQRCIHNWFIQLRNEFCPDFDAVWDCVSSSNFEIFYNHSTKKWDYCSCDEEQNPTIIYFSQESAEIIVEKLNNGEIILPNFLS